MWGRLRKGWGGWGRLWRSQARKIQIHALHRFPSCPCPVDCMRPVLGGGADAQTFWKKKITPLDARAGAATQVMVHLAEDAWAPTTYRQLFEWCAGTQAPAELVAAPNDKSKGLWAIEN